MTSVALSTHRGHLGPALVSVSASLAHESPLRTPLVSDDALSTHRAKKLAERL